MKIQTCKHEIEIITEATYRPGSKVNSREYLKEYILDKQPWTPTSGVICSSVNGQQYSCVIAASGCAGPVKKSDVIVVSDTLLIAVGNHVYCLSLPSLDVQWFQEVDFASCFGIFYLEDHNCIISHGEVDIVRISLDGVIEWRASGRDIFTEGFTLYEDYIEVIDFNQDKYRIDTITGDVSIIKT